jgi:hypothetical protein
MRVRSTTAAPRIEARPTRKPQRRKGLVGAQPAVAPEPRGEQRIGDDRDHEAGTAMREPTMSPAPTFDIDRPLAPITARRSMSHPPPLRAGARSEAADRRFRSFLSVSARMMFATA